MEIKIVRTFNLEITDYSFRLFQWMLDPLVNDVRDSDLTQVVKDELAEIIERGDKAVKRMIELFNARMNHQSGEIDNQLSESDSFTREDLDEYFSDFINRYPNVSKYLWIIIAG